MGIWKDNARDTVAEFYEVIEGVKVISAQSFPTYDEALQAATSILKSSYPGREVEVWGFVKRATLKITPTEPEITHHSVDLPLLAPPKAAA